MSGIYLTGAAGTAGTDGSVSSIDGGAGGPGAYQITTNNGNGIDAFNAAGAMGGAGGAGGNGFSRCRNGRQCRRRWGRRRRERGCANSDPELVVLGLRVGRRPLEGRAAMPARQETQEPRTRGPARMAAPAVLRQPTLRLQIRPA